MQNKRWLKSDENFQGRIQKIQKEGAEFPPPPNENFTFQDMQLTALYRIRDAK